MSVFKLNLRILSQKEGRVGGREVKAGGRRKYWTLLEYEFKLSNEIDMVAFGIMRRLLRSEIRLKALENVK